MRRKERGIRERPSSAPDRSFPTIAASSGSGTSANRRPPLVAGPWAGPPHPPLLSRAFHRPESSRSFASFAVRMNSLSVQTVIPIAPRRNFAETGRRAPATQPGRCLSSSWSPAETSKLAAVISFSACLLLSVARLRRRIRHRNVMDRLSRRTPAGHQV